MTLLHSKLLRAVTALAVIAGLMAPAFALAEESSASGALKPKSGGAANFCSRLDGLGTTITTRIPKREDKHDERLDDRVTKVNGRFEFRVGKLEDKREDWDKNREDRYAKLEARATTTAQQSAVTAFETAIDAAVKTRRDAIDAAIKTFQDGVNKLLTDRQAAVDAAFATLKTATDAAIAKAKSDCAGGTDPQTVRTNLMNDLKAANQAFKDAIKPSDTVQNSLKSLRDTRDAAVKAAIDAFKATYQAELQKLKTAFGVTT